MNKDLDYLCKRTNLSLNQLLTLLEDDYNLMIDSLAINKVEADTISFPLFTKFTILHKTKGQKFSLNEKIYVADSLSIYFPKLYKNSYYLVDNQKVTENTIRFYLVLLGMFPEYILGKTKRYGTPNLDFYIRNMKNQMIQLDHVDLANHADDWINILYEIKNDEWC